MSGQVRAGETGVMDEDVRRYRDEMDSEHRPVFDRLHQLIVATCPDAEVVLSYGMPTYVVGGRRLHVGMWKHGLSFYGWQQSRDAGFTDLGPVTEEFALSAVCVKLPAERVMLSAFLTALAEATQWFRDHVEESAALSASTWMVTCGASPSRARTPTSYSRWRGKRVRAGSRLRFAAASTAMPSTRGRRFK